MKTFWGVPINTGAQVQERAVWLIFLTTIISVAYWISTQVKQLLLTLKIIQRKLKEINPNVVRAPTIIYHAVIHQNASVFLLICIHEIARWCLYFNSNQNRLLSPREASVLLKCVVAYSHVSDETSLCTVSIQSQNFEKFIVDLGIGTLINCCLSRENDPELVDDATQNYLENIACSFEADPLFRHIHKRSKCKLRHDAHFNSAFHVHQFCIDKKILCFMPSMKQWYFSL